MLSWGLTTNAGGTLRVLITFNDPRLVAGSLTHSPFFFMVHRKVSRIWWKRKGLEIGGANITLRYLKAHRFSVKKEDLLRTRNCI